MKYTIEQMFNMVEHARQQLDNQDSREQHLAREVYKDKKNKIVKYVSRLSEESDPLTSSPLGPSAREVGPEGLEGLCSQEEEVSVITPARTSPRITGISMQHVRTERGIKINVAIQDEEDAKQGLYVELTAELKRHGRLRELKRYKGDSYEFEELYIATINELKELSPKQGKRIAIGRLHERGVRGKWVANMMVVATLDESGTIATDVVININGEEYEIVLDGQMSPSQEKIYHNTGIYGNLSSTKSTPTLATLKRKTFNP